MSKKTMKSKSRKHRGGMQGFGYAPGAALLPGVQIDAQMRVPYDSCMTVDRPGQQAFSNLGGLPGMKGGGNCGRLVLLYVNNEPKRNIGSLGQFDYYLLCNRAGSF